MTLLDHHVIKIHPDSIHLLLPETFSLKNKNINLTVTVDKKSGHRRSLLDSSYEGHNCLQEIYRRSVQELLRYFSLDRPTERLWRPLKLLLAWLKTIPHLN